MYQFNDHPLYRRHNIDSAMNSLWGYYKKNFLVLFMVSFIMSLVIQYISSGVDLKDLQSVTDPMVMLEKLKVYLWPMIMVSLVTLFFSTILNFYIIHNPVDRENNIFVSAVKSMRYFVPYLIIIVLFTFAGSFAMVLGLFVFIIGAFFVFLYLMTLYLFILPVLMIEGPSISNTISRTFKLAHRGFWSNIGWVAIFLILMIITSVIFSGLILIPFSGSFFKVLTNPENVANMVNLAQNPVYIALSSITNALIFPLMPIFACILYFNSKAGEEQVESTLPVEPEDKKVKVEDLYSKPYSEEHPENPDKEKKP